MRTMFIAAALSVAVILPAAAQERRVCSPDSTKQAMAQYRLKWGNAEAALNCAGFYNLPAKINKSGPPQCNEEHLPHPAVRHVAEVDWAPRGGSAPKLCEYIKVPQNKKWYMDNFQIKPIK